MTLRGTLEDFSPGGILRVLSSDGRTGAVRFGGESRCTVYLDRGLLYVACDDRTDAALAAALVRPGRLTTDMWAEAVEASGDRPMIGELLVRKHAIHPDLLASVVLSIVYDPLISLFRAGEGDFEFEPDMVHWLGPFRAFPVEAIVAEVRRRVREADEWSGVIPTFDAWVDACRTLPSTTTHVTLQREDWELVAALAGPRTVEDLAAELGRGRYSTARVVHRLHQADLVDVVTNPSPANPSTHRAALPVPAAAEPPAVDPVSVGRPPVIDSNREVVHHTPVAALRRRRKGGLQGADRAGAHRSHA